MKIQTILSICCAGVALANPEAASPASERDPFASAIETAQSTPTATEISDRTMIVRVEVWEMTRREMVATLDEFATSGGPAAWRKDRLSESDGTLVFAPAVAVNVGGRNSVESIRELTYPTEYEPPRAAPRSARRGNPARSRGAASASSFETRNTGLNLEAAVEPVESDDDRVDLEVKLTNVRLEQFRFYGPESLGIKMPDFGVWRTGGHTRIDHGRWALLSSTESPGSKDSVWLTLVKVQPAN